MKFFGSLLLNVHFFQNLAHCEPWTFKKKFPTEFTYITEGDQYARQKGHESIANNFGFIFTVAWSDVVKLLPNFPPYPNFF